MMENRRTAWTGALCLGAGLAWGLHSSCPTWKVFADDLPAVTPAVAGPTKSNAITRTDHLRQAAEHLDAAGQTGLAQHVRQLADQASVDKPGRLPAYGPAAPPQALPFDAFPPTEWTPRPVVPPRGRVSLEVPPEWDDGHLRFVQPVGRKVDTRETRTTTAAPPRGPI